MDELIMEYLKKFDDCFPIEVMRGKSEEEIEAMIKKCFAENKPFEVEYDDDCDY